MAKTYGTYKDSGSVWVGDIPSEWNIGNFRYFGEFTKGKLPSTSNTEGIGLPIIGASEMLGKECRTFSEDANVPQCSNDDILILWDGANAGIISSHHKGIVSSTAVKYHCLNSDVDKNFLYYFLKSVEPNFKEKVNGTTIPHMNIKYINEIPLLMPPLSVQQSISSFLDTKCGEIDSLISIQEEMISELLAYKQSVITEAVTKGLDKKAKMKNSGVEWIGDIPEEWSFTKLKNIINYIESGVSVNAGLEEVSHKDIGVLKTSCVSKNKFLANECKKVFETELSRVACPVKANTIIVSRMNTPELVGACGYVDHDYNNIFLPDRLWQVHFLNTAFVKFVYYSLISKRTKSYFSSLSSGTSSSMQNISQPQFQNTIIALPPLPVQQAIATYLDEKTTQIDSLIALKQSKIESLKEYKKSIIYEYVTGKKRV